MRFITAVTLRLDQLTEVGDSGTLLLKRHQRKCVSAKRGKAGVRVRRPAC